MKDVLGHDIEAGALVLTSGYRTPRLFIVTRVVRLNRKTIVVEIPMTNKITGQTYKVMAKRKPHQIINVEAQLMYNKDKYPESFI